MPNYRRQFQPGGTFFFTVVTAQRRNLFSDDVTHGHLRNAITTVQAEQPFDIVAIVLLPNHIHCIWTLPENDSDFSHAPERSGVRSLAETLLGTSHSR